MGKVVVTEFVSVDGVMEDPGGAESFEFGGWTFPYWNGDIATFKLDELMAAEAHLLGRVTYEGFAAAWPSVTDEAGFADRMNNLPKYVVTSTLDHLAWNNSHLVTGDLAAAVTALKEQTNGDILVAGSATLAQSLLREDLVDELHLAVYPVVLGTGKRLFGATHTYLELVDQRPTPTGVILLTYRRSEKP